MTFSIDPIDIEVSVPPRPRDPEDDNFSDDGTEADDMWREEWLEENPDSRQYTKPEPNYQGHCYHGENVNDSFSFLKGKEKKLQVIVKLANIHLTPEKPEYKGGSWHIEGQLNEHIVSTALYYYDNVNVTDSRLHFETKVSYSLQENLKHEQGDYDGIRAIFGFTNDDGMVQQIGSVLTREDRLIAFPNGFRHRVGKFRLADPTKPGHRKILAFFLVEPNIPVISTANVPPQQKDWWKREVLTGTELGERLNPELFDMVVDNVEDFPISLEDAKNIRDELMKERGAMNMHTDGLYEGHTFSFCEH